jgi:hypothetical protein
VASSGTGIYRSECRNRGISGFLARFFLAHDEEADGDVLLVAMGIIVGEHELEFERVW